MSGVEGSPEVACIGAACVDHLFRTNERALAGTSNPATCARSFGGVARNVAENLAQLGARVSLCSVVGNDEDGRRLVEHLCEAGVEASGVAFSDAYPTPQYVAIIGPDGDFFAGASDVRAIEEVTAIDLRRWLATSAAAAWIFLDCNLPAAALSACVEARASSSWKLAIDGTSVAKVQRLPRDLSNVDVLFVNEGESAALGATEAKATVVLRGGAGVTIRHAERSERASACDIPAAKALPVDTTGAGDALIAGTLWSLLKGRAIDEAVTFGMQVAAETVQTLGAVPRLRSFHSLRSG